MVRTDAAEQAGISTGASTSQKRACRAVPGDPRLTLSIEETGRILGISRGAAYAYAKAGTIPTIRLGKRRLVPKAAIDRMLGLTE